MQRRRLAEAYRRFAADPATSPLSARVAAALGASAQALGAIEAAPANRRHPALILAALHDLALAGRAPALAAACASGDADAAAAAATATLRAMSAEVAAIAARRRVPRDETGRATVLYPAIAEAARRAGADAVGLIDVRCSAALNLTVDRVRIDYGDGLVPGDPASPARMSASVVGDRPVPDRPMPPVVARIGVDRAPLDVTDPEDARWLRATVPPDEPERRALLEAQLTLAAAAPPVLLRSDPVQALPDAIGRVPAGALPVVITTWALSQLRPGRRAEFVRRLRDAAADRPVAWVSAEGVGVAPEIPTLGDRRAPGHSILGLALAERSTLHTAALGRCWSRGRLLSWLV